MVKYTMRLVRRNCSMLLHTVPMALIFKSKEIYLCVCVSPSFSRDRATTRWLTTTNNKEEAHSVIPGWETIRCIRACTHGAPRTELKLMPLDAAIISCVCSAYETRAITINLIEFRWKTMYRLQENLLCPTSGWAHTGRKDRNVKQTTTTTTKRQKYNECTIMSTTQQSGLCVSVHVMVGHTRIYYICTPKTPWRSKAATGH